MRGRQMRTAGATAQHRDYTGAKMGMWLFLFTEMLLFGGLFLLYSVYRSLHPGEFHRAAAGLNLTIGAANTVLLITSSLTMAMSVSALHRGAKGRSLFLQALTISLGAAFLVNKYFEWGEKIGHGLYPDGPGLNGSTQGEVLFYGLYYVMTGLHGLHVLLGVILIAAILFLMLGGRAGGKNPVRLENTGLYWHLVDVIWIYLFPLFYLVT